jgi:hypothetical protein
MFDFYVFISAYHQARIESKEAGSRKQEAGSSKWREHKTS